MNKTTFTPGGDDKTMVITRTFDAPLQRVWEAWTTQELLEKWWAPAPWKAVTKDFDFREGGRWLYAMTGPDGEKHWSLEKYLTIDPKTSFTADDFFCDEEGISNQDMPSNRWNVAFLEHEGKTDVTVTMTARSAQDLQKLTEMGFKEGFSQGLDQLEELLR